MNEVALIGRLTKSPEVNDTKNGKKRSGITLAVQRPFKNVNNVYETDFIPIVLWDVIAKNTAEYCKVGDLIGVKGRIQTNNYEDAEGNKKTSVEVVAEKISFLSSSRKEDTNKAE